MHNTSVMQGLEKAEIIITETVRNFRQRVWLTIHIVPASEASLPELCSSILGLFTS